MDGGSSQILQRRRRPRLNPLTPLHPRVPLLTCATAAMTTTSHSKAFLLLLLLVTLCSVLFYCVSDHLPTHPVHVPPRNLSILLWRWPFGRSYSLHGDKCLELYNISRCFLTDDVSAYRTADVVVFHHLELSKRRASLPEKRLPSQHWVWMSMEPPAHYGNLTGLNGVFNWTMSYRLDADIHIPYGMTLSGGEGGPSQPPPNGSCLVSWVVSNYQSGQARAIFYQRLRDYIPIKVYGRWKRKPLSEQRLLPTIGKCLFYLSFENCQSKDYISEKLWRNAFEAGVVPVVLGPDRRTYEALAPPGSFIHVTDFKSPADLAAYMQKVAANKTAYQRYFGWRQTHRIKTYTDWRERLCQICVQYPNLAAHKVYHDLQNWAHGGEF